MATPGRASDPQSQPNREDIFRRKLAEPDEIRLLVLQPSQPVGGEGRGIIFCRLFVVSLIDPDFPPDLIDGAAAQKPEYEAVSWCWDEDEEQVVIKVSPPDGEHYLDFWISKNLNFALQSLRSLSKPRSLWIDAICIDQGNTVERNSQVPKMDRIYGQANNVCVWVGMDDQYSKMALQFIREQILRKIWDFDDICSNRNYAESWASLIRLMSRAWFSRRWVIQEIALAKKGTLYCGTDWIPWQDFADAVSLFVHVESATHRLSDVMKKDETFANLPQFFGDVHTLGAALLVDATTNLFRTSQDGKRHPRLNLEQLISKYSLFQASQPRDVIYAFLSIARDTKPETSLQSFLSTQNPEMLEVQRKLRELPRPREIYRILTEWSRRMSSVQPYVVNYNLPAEEIYKDFIWFSIQRSMRTDATRALDIICRPWAPRVAPENTHARRTREVDGEAQWQQPVASDANGSNPPLPSWIPDLSEAPFGMDVHTKERLGSRMKRRNADPLVGLPSSGERIYNAAGTRSANITKIKFTIGSARFPPATRDDWEERTKPRAWEFQPCSFEAPPDMPFKIRKPELCHCQLLQNSSRYYSMIAEGFILDEIGDVQAESQLGAIPPTWLQFAQKTANRQNDLPDDLWRTIVADRGPHGQNALTFYPRTCREAFRKLVNDDRNPLNTTEIIETGGCTIIAEFLRRVQAVIWNRRLMSAKNGRYLGLVPAKATKGDLICILYGCSVPVVMRRRMKSDIQIQDEATDQVRLQRKTAAEFIARNWRQSKNRRKAVRRTQQRRETLPQPPPRRSMLELAASGMHTVSQLSRVLRKMSCKLLLPLWSTIRLLSAFIRLIWIFLLLGTFSQPLYSIFEAIMYGTTLDLIIPANLMIATTQDIFDIPHDLAFDLDIQSRAKAIIARTAHNGWHILLHVGKIICPLTIAYYLLKPYAMQKIQQSDKWIKYLSQEAPKQSGPDPKYYYTMIGECYVHQMMDGEAIAWQNEDRDNRSPMLFELR